MHWSKYASQVASIAGAVPDAPVSALLQNLLVAAQRGRTIFTCGNGGSGSSASHLAEDLAKGTIVPGAPRVRAISLCDSVPKILAWANDEGYGRIFAEQLISLGQPGDVLIAISGSGNSENVLNAVCAAHNLNMRTWGICGFDGGHLADIAHRFVHVECDHMGQVEDVHMMLFHWLTDELKEALKGALPVDTHPRPESATYLEDIWISRAEQ